VALLWFMVILAAFDLAAALFAAESRPGFVDNPRWWHRRRVGG
jgi:hypothetical protein